MEDDFKISVHGEEDRFTQHLVKSRTLLRSKKKPPPKKSLLKTEAALRCASGLIRLKYKNG